MHPRTKVLLAGAAVAAYIYHDYCITKLAGHLDELVIILKPIVEEFRQYEIDEVFDDIVNTLDDDLG